MLPSREMGNRVGRLVFLVALLVVSPSPFACAKTKKASFLDLSEHGHSRENRF